MAKSLEELQLAFKARYPIEEDKKQEEPDVLQEESDIVQEEPDVIQAAAEELDATEKRDITKDYSIDTTIVEDIKREKIEEEQKLADKQQDKKRNKASVISDIIFYIALVAMVFCAVLFSRGAFGNQTFGGYKFYEVLTTSMDSVYPRGSLILIKNVDANELVVGDDITFTRDSSNLITHRIVEIKENYEGSGSRAFVTKGVDNAAADKELIPAGNVVGKVVKGFSGLGAMLSWVGSNMWIVLILFLSLMALSFFLKIFWREQKKQKKIKSNG